MRTDKHALAPQGIDGGHPGGTGGCIINPGAVDERSMPSRFGDQRLKTGDVLRVERPGGGGVVLHGREDEIVLDRAATRELRSTNDVPVDPAP